MTTVTITIDDPNGLNSNLLFPSAFPNDVFSGSSAPSSGSLGFRRYVNGVVDPSVSYSLAATGSSFALLPIQIPVSDLSGFVNAFTFTRTPSGGSGTQIMHVDFALDGTWATSGGVYISSFAGLTVDVLMNRIAERTPANLIVIGNVGNDVLNGSFLNDTLRGAAGADLLIGGAGTDVASYEGSNVGVTVNLATGAASGGHATGDRFSSIENVLGSSFEDTLTGNAAANFLDGGLGFDVMDGGAGDDFIFGRDGGGVLRGGAGNDRIDGGVQNDTIYGGIGNDELRVGDGDNSGFGEDGNDVLRGAGGVDRLFGGAGIDFMRGDVAADLLDGGVGADTMWGGIGNDTYVVDNAGDVIDEINDLGNGIDTVISSISFSLLPSTRVIGDVERLTLSGTANISATGNALANILTGNAGSNVLNGGGSADTMLGRAGNDTYVVNTALDIVSESGGSGIDTIVSSVSLSLVRSARLVGDIERLYLAGTAAANGIGNALANSIVGNGAANILNGGAGNDVINGSGGNDTIYGSAGNDTLTGGPGNDFFAFNTAPNTLTNRDRIADFSAVADTILMENAIFTRLTATGTLNAGNFRLGAAALDANDYVIYNPATGVLTYDSNGNAAGGAVQFGLLLPAVAISAADFVVV